MIYHLHRSEWPALKSLQINAGEGMEKREPHCCWRECKLVQPLRKTVRSASKKQKAECRGPAPVDPGNSKGGRRWSGKTCLLI